MFRYTVLSTSLFLTACGGMTITSTAPQYATPSEVAERARNTIPYLECGSQQDTIRAVGMLTFAQINSPGYAVSFTEGLPDRCRAGNVTKIGRVLGLGSAITTDGWKVNIVSWEQANGYAIVYADSANARFVGNRRRSRPDVCKQSWNDKTEDQIQILIQSCGRRGYGF